MDSLQNLSTKITILRELNKNKLYGKYLFEQKNNANYKNT